MKYSFPEMIGASVLLTAWLIYSVNAAGNFLIHVEETAPSTPAPTASAPAPATTAKAEPATKPLKAPPPVKMADTASTVARGAKIFKKCKSCHTADKGGKNKFGPNLWGVVDRAKASAAGYKYSSTLSGLGGKWSSADLDAFLDSPKKFAKGTKMSFGGLKKAADRAAMIAFLRGQSDAPKTTP